jgi:transcriptional regulator with XRE-family HTH domain
MTDAATYPDIGHRLASIRRGFSDMTQTEWAKRHNFAVTQYNNWEKGARRIPVEAAEKLCEVYGITLDFIYRGRRDGLSKNRVEGSLIASPQVLHHMVKGNVQFVGDLDHAA